MDDKIKEIINPGKEITFSLCQDIEFRLAETIRRKTGLTVTNDFDTYWNLDSTKYTMEVCLYDRHSDLKEDYFFMVVDDFFGVPYYKYTEKIEKSKRCINYEVAL